MNKYFKIMLFLIFLRFASYFVSFLFFNDTGIAVSEEHIVVIPVDGMITLYGESSLLSSSTSAEEIVAEIGAANEDASVKGIVLEINSPGGTVMGSKVIADALKKVDKPVVAVITEYGTSGAYWVASQTDYIVADQLSIVGSIGVLGSYLDFSGLLNDYNVTYQRLVTGEYKDISTPYRAMTLEEEALILERLQGIHEYFVEDVAEGRGLDVEDVSALADGLFYLGQDGVKNGLVDYIGDKDYAIALVEELAGISDGYVSEYEKEETFFESISKYLSYTSFYIGQGIGSVLFSVDHSVLDIHV